MQLKKAGEGGIGLVELGRGYHTQSLAHLPQNLSRTAGRAVFGNQLQCPSPLPTHTFFDAEKKRVRCTAPLNRREACEKYLSRHRKHGRIPSELLIQGGSEGLQ